MADSLTYNLGTVTAYGSAKEGGYTGTYEEFCESLAKAGTAADNAAAAATSASASATSASAAETSASAAETSASTAATSASASATSASAAETSAREAAASAAAANASTTAASTAAAMTDTSKIYVYTGSETGYTNGNWYYYDGSAWVSGGAFNAAGCDDALSDTSTNAVQNKVVNGAIDDLKSSLNSTVFVVGTTKSPIVWEQGNINGSGGGTQANSKRIRTNAFEKGDIYSIAPLGSYRLELAAYDTQNNNAYLGMWDGTSFVKSAQFSSAEIVMFNMPETYLYKIVLDYATDIDPTAYTNCVVQYENYVEKTDVSPEKWDSAYDKATALQDGFLPYLEYEFGTFGSSGQKVSSSTVIRTKINVTFAKDTIIRCNDSNYFYEIREYSAPEISADNFISYYGRYYGTYKLIVGKYYAISIGKRDETSVESVATASKKVEIWSSAYLESMRKYELKRLSSFGNGKRKIIAHRGTRTNAPENTVPAFEAAGVGDAWGIETDINATSDGYLVCIHDTTLDRTTTGTGAVAEHTFAEIEALSIKDHPDLKVPTVEQFLGICKTYDCVPVMELKNMFNNQEMVTKLISTIVSYGLDAKCIILCSQYSIGYVQCVNEKIPCIFIIDPTDANDLSRPSRYFNVNATIESGSYTVTREIISTLHANGVNVNIGGVNSVNDIKSYLAMGADSVSSDYITTY